MLLGTFEPGKEMAFANFFLAIFGLFTICLPLLLITRGDKTEANRDFLLATVNPWSKVIEEPELAKVVVSEISSSVKAESKPEIEHEQELIPVSGGVISLEIKGGDEFDEPLAEVIKTDEEPLAA